MSMGNCNSQSKGGSKDKATTCLSNLDCAVTECCKSFAGLQKYCSSDCSSWTSEQYSNWRYNPPVGNYAGQNFWNRWQRRARLEKK